MADIRQGHAATDRTGTDSRREEQRVNPHPSSVDATKPYLIYISWPGYGAFPYIDNLVNVVESLLITSPDVTVWDDKEALAVLGEQWQGEIPYSEQALWDEEFRGKTKNKAVYGPLKGSRDRDESASVWVMGSNLVELYRQLSLSGYTLYVEGEDMDMLLRKLRTEWWEGNNRVHAPKKEKEGQEPHG